MPVPQMLGRTASWIAVVLVVLWGVAVVLSGDLRNQISIWLWPDWPAGAHPSADMRKVLGSAIPAFVAGIVSLGMALCAARWLLLIALTRRSLWKPLETICAAAQAIPIQGFGAGVFVLLMASGALLKRWGWVLPMAAVPRFFVLVPVTLAALLPSFVFGVRGVREAPIEIKYLLRVLNIDSRVAARLALRPLAMPHLLDGLQASSAWTIVAVVIAQQVFAVPGSLGYYLGLKTSDAKFKIALWVTVVLGLTLYGFCRWVCGVWDKKVRGIPVDRESYYQLKLRAGYPDRNNV